MSEAIRIASLLQFRASSDLAYVVPPSEPGSGDDALAAAQQFGLSERELEVLHLLADGKSTREIADALYIAPRTAATHINNIIGKLEVSSRTAAVALAMRLGIV